MERYTDMDDQRLARLAREDHDAFEVLYRRHVTPVFRYCYARVENVHDAEDLTAQTFLVALESIRRYRGRGAFRSWLFGIARHKCMDHHRTAYAKPQTSMENLQMLDTNAEDAEQHSILSDILDCVEKLLPVLSPDRLEALRLRYWGGLSMREIGKVMRRSEAAAKMLVSRAISDLRERCVVQ